MSLEMENKSKCENLILFLFFFGLFVPSISIAGSDTAVTNYNQGLSFFFENYLSEALTRFLQTADENFNSWQSYEMVGFCYFEMREKDGALAAFEESLKINPRNPQLAKIYNNLKAGAADIPLRPVADAGGFLPGT
jgi:tetratricopeptide (TPR) repeat protein